MEPILNIPCIILSGGQSKRMGEDKSLLPFGDEKSLIAYQYKKLSQIFQNVYISSKIHKFDFPCKIIYDRSEIFSPMVALKSILSEFDNTKVFIITVDTPNINEETISKLIANGDNFDVTVCADKEKTHNLCGIFSSNILPQINNMLKNDNHKINYLLTKLVKLQVINFENSEQFLNINTKSDYLASMPTLAN